MIFSLTKATPIFTVLSRLNSGWFPNMRNSSKVVPAGQNHQKTPADSSMFGLLVSNDPARGHWF